jgi:hypothetical protein
MQVDKAIHVQRTSLSNIQWTTSTKALVESGVVGFVGRGANALYFLIERLKESLALHNVAWV